MVTFLALVGVLAHNQSYEKPPLFYQANKFGLKTLLHMCALSAATQLKGKLKDYFDRKVAQGKKKMSVLNAVRNKLIHHIFACVKKKQKYDENYIYNFA